MMTIIKMGQLPKSPKYQTTCSHCQTVFIHEECDCVPYQQTHPKKVICPLCQTAVLTQIMKHRSATYEVISDFFIKSKKTFRFNPKR